MCDITDGFKLCTCTDQEQQELGDLYWVLQRRKASIVPKCDVVGSIVFPEYSKQEEDMITLVLQNLNQRNLQEYVTQTDISTLTGQQQQNTTDILSVQTAVYNIELDYVTTSMLNGYASESWVLSNAALGSVVEDLSDYLQVDTNTNSLIFSGANSFVQSGSGSIDDGSENGDPLLGLGNLIIGYNETDGTLNRDGSHNLVIGDQHSYSSYGGLVAGYGNIISNKHSSVLGGRLNETSGEYSSICGGYEGTSSGNYSSISGGYQNISSNSFTSVSGGGNNEASGPKSSISGGSDNIASGSASSVSGGDGNESSGLTSSISGGSFNETVASFSHISGGYNNTSSGFYSSVLGGADNEALGTSSSIAGGYLNTANGHWLY